MKETPIALSSLVEGLEAGAKKIICCCTSEELADKAREILIPHLKVGLAALEASVASGDLEQA